MNQGIRSYHLGSSDMQALFCFLRVLLLAVMVGGFGVICSSQFNGVVPVEMAANYRANSPWVFGGWPDWILVPLAAVINPYSVRYWLAPLTAIVCVIIAGANYIKDVYALPTFKDALHYVVASMFSIRYPIIRIDKGEKQIRKREVNLLDSIGGPGFAIIEPGSAAIFRHLREPSRAEVATTYFMAPFETIAHTVDLGEQQPIKNGIQAMTRDGIKVELRDVHIRYRILQARDGKPVKRTITDPYPFDSAVLSNMILNLTVQKNGLDKWNDAIERPIVGEITDFIAMHTIDYLTAPREGTPNPRIELNRIMTKQLRKTLENSGAELLWLDMGHMEIIDDRVDKQRTDLWAADWIGDIRTKEAYSEAIRQSYSELGRAQAQAEIIMSIAEALRGADLNERPALNIRRLMLARTSQLLDAMHVKARNRKE
jgi:hypothetical protein